MPEPGVYRKANVTDRDYRLELLRSVARVFACRRYVMTSKRLLDPCVDDHAGPSPRPATKAPPAAYKG